VGQVITGGSGTVTPSNTAVSYVGVGGEASPVETDVAFTLPVGGTLKDFHVYADKGPGAGQTWDVNILKNGIGGPTALICSIPTSAGNTPSRCTDNNPAHNVTVSAGDTISVRLSPNATPTSTPFSWRVTLTQP
jgi:hypothetical protein